MQKIIVMIGQPSVGKTTVVESMGGQKENYIINIDNIFTQVSQENGLKYSEMFVKPKYETPEGSIEEGMEKYGKVVEIYNRDTGEFLYKSFENIDKLRGPDGSIVQRRMSELTSNALKQEKNIIVDMTMLTIKDRKTILETIIKDNNITNITIEAIVFETKTLRMFQDLQDIEIKQERIKKIEQEFLKGVYGPFKDHIQVMENRTAQLIKEGKDPKQIPNMVLVAMAAKYEEPTKEEGFHNIKYVQVDHSKFNTKKVEEVKEKDTKKNVKKAKIQEIK